MPLNGGVVVLVIVLVSSASGAYLYFAAGPSATPGASLTPSLQIPSSRHALLSPQLPQHSQFSGSSHPHIAKIAAVLQQHPAVREAIIQAVVNHSARGHK